MKESVIERKLYDGVKRAGGRCWKWVSPGRAGVPDRICMMPHGVIYFVELKAPGKTERKLQVYVQNILRDLGFTVFSSVDSIDAVNAVIQWGVDMSERMGILYEDL